MASSESCSGWMGVIELVPEGNIDAERESSNGSRMVDKGRSKICRGRLEIRARVETQPGLVAVAINGKLLLSVNCVRGYTLAVIACSKPRRIVSRVVTVGESSQTTLENTDKVTTALTKTAHAIFFFSLNGARSVELIHDFESEA